MLHRLQLQISAAILVSMFLTLNGTAAKAANVLSGEVCQDKVHQLTSDITWYKSLSKAEEDAKRESKLIFWVHMLGKIDGAT